MCIFIYVLLLRTAFVNPKCFAIYIQYIKFYLYLFQVLRSTLITCKSIILFVFLLCYFSHLVLSTFILPHIQKYI